MMLSNFSALVVNKTEESFNVGVKELSEKDLPNGDVTIKVEYSSINYKDGLASIPDGNIVKEYPFIPGIDLSGTVVSSESETYKNGDKVIITGYDLGVSHFGGFSEYARVPAEWIVPLPEGLSTKEAMAYGTAGFTAALSIYRLEENGISPEKGPILVTGSTGGVGSHAVSILSQLGYDVTASTGSSNEHHYLKEIGANEIIDRNELEKEKIRPLDKQLWAGAVDPVGGKSLAYILSTVKYGGSVAVSGLVGGPKVPTTVFPFILRGVNLLGIDSVYCDMELRKKLWDNMANEYKTPSLLTDISKEITLQDLPDELPKILKGESRGRVIVSL